MKNHIFHILFIIFLSTEVYASDDYVIIYGDKVQPKENQKVDMLCFNNQEYKVFDKELNGVKSREIKANLHRPWFKLAFKGKCKGLPTIERKQAILANSSEINLKYIEEGKKEYPVKIKTHKRYDRNLKDFYSDVNQENFQPIYKSTTIKWPLGHGAFLLEQCFTVSANVESFPSQKRDFVFGQKYRQKIIDGNVEKILVDTELNLTWAYCECDGNPPPTCKSISNVTDINGNGKYEILDGWGQPEGERLELKEYDGKSLHTVFRMCTGDLSFPFNTFKCPNK